ncbi:MAG TPA: PEGA domain-containing protein, partial [Kofleriaceae bacterium]|nr:PEGA domain-containing protein [Kofleriaceae bacterium]
GTTPSIREATSGSATLETARPDAVNPEAFKPDAAVSANGSDVGSAAIHEESITIHVASVPPGADVLFAGKPIGTTPLETKVPRSTGFGTLTVHHARFEDVTTTIDLSSDYQRSLTLKPLPDEPPARPSTPSRPAGGHERSGSERSGSERNSNGSGKQHTAPALSAPTPPTKKCQPPDKYNPFDTNCGGQPCPPCQ